jgi:hypothetical protein
MTTAIGLVNIPTSSPTDVAVYFLNQTLLKRRQTNVKGNLITTEYVYSAGDPNTETSLVVSVEANTAANTVRISWALKTVQTVTVDSVVTETAPVTVSLSATIPGRSEDTSKILGMIGTLFSLTFNGDDQSS